MFKEIEYSLLTPAGARDNINAAPASLGGRNPKRQQHDLKGNQLERKNHDQPPRVRSKQTQGQQETGIKPVTTTALRSRKPLRYQRVPAITTNTKTTRNDNRTRDHINDGAAVNQYAITAFKQQQQELTDRQYAQSPRVRSKHKDKDNNMTSRATSSKGKTTPNLQGCGRNTTHKDNKKQESNPRPHQ